MQQTYQTRMLMSGIIPNEPLEVNGNIDTVAISNLADNMNNAYHTPLKNNTEIDSIYLAMINNIFILKQEKDDIADSYHAIKHFDALILEQAARIDSIKTKILVKY